jgi:dTDP-4-amino-4,6-dideoxygalactose transaminase
MTIPVMKPNLGPEEAEAAAAAVASGWVAQGPRVAAFEEAFASSIGVPHGVAVSSCTTALHLALVVAGVGAGDEVVIPSLSFIATANAARYVGANPVFADVDAATLNLTARTRAVIAVDQAGVPADIDAIRALCDPRGITVVEDAACAAGSTYHGAPVGRASVLAAYSFHPRKLLTTGEGGMIVSTDADLATRARRLREHGMSVSAAERHASGGVVLEQYLETGFNFRMTDIQAAVGLVQLGRLPGMVAGRREMAARYHELLADVPGITTITDPAHGTTNFQSFWVLLPEEGAASRNDLLQALVDADVSPRRGIMAAHLEPAYADHPHIPLPVTERITKDSLILPLHHELTAEDQERIVDVVAATLGVPAGG